MCFSRLLFTVVFVFCIFSACSKNKEDNPMVYQNKSANVKLTNSTWYTTLTNNSKGLYFGHVSLKIAGSTNADKILIRTSGDGEEGWPCLTLDSNKNFSNDIEICFLPIYHNPKGEETSSQTTLKAIKGTDTLEIKLTSGKLIY